MRYDYDDEKTWWLILACVVLATLILVGSKKAARAHDAAQWIQDQGWKNEAGELCCGARDCTLLEADDVEVRRGGYWVKSMKVLVPYDKTLPSINGRFWICVWGGEVKCFFAGPSGV